MRRYAHLADACATYKYGGDNETSVDESSRCG